MQSTSHDERARSRHAQLFGQPPRIPPLDRESHGAQIVNATTRLKNAVRCEDGPPIALEHCPEMVATLLRYPALWDRLAMLSAQVQCANAKLPGRMRQLAILRVVWLCGAPYQWGEHLARTRQAGVTEEEIEQIKEGARHPAWSMPDRAILAAVDEYQADHFVHDETWRRLADRLDEQQLIELLVLIGQFASVAFLMNSLRLRLEPNNRGFLPE